MTELFSVKKIKLDSNANDHGTLKTNWTKRLSSKSSNSASSQRVKSFTKKKTRKDSSSSSSSDDSKEKFDRAHKRTSQVKLESRISSNSKKASKAVVESGDVSKNVLQEVEKDLKAALKNGDVSKHVLQEVKKDLKAINSSRRSNVSSNTVPAVSSKAFSLSRNSQRDINSVKTGAEEPRTTKKDINSVHSGAVYSKAFPLSRTTKKDVNSVKSGAEEPRTTKKDINSVHSGAVYSKAFSLSRTTKKDINSVKSCAEEPTTTKKDINSVHSSAEEAEDVSQWKYFSFVGSYMVAGPVLLALLTLLITVACLDDAQAENVAKHFFLIGTVYALAKCM